MCKFAGTPRGDSAYKTVLLQGGVNWFRYVEYSISASLMLVLITIQLGIWEWGVLVGIATCTWACMMFGLLSDIFLHLDRSSTAMVRYAVLAHLCGWVCLAGPFWVILATFDGIRDLAPDFVVIIVSLQVALFNGFGVTQLAQICLIALAGPQSFEHAVDSAVLTPSEPVTAASECDPRALLASSRFKLTSVSHFEYAKKEGGSWELIQKLQHKLKKRNYVGVFTETSFVTQSFVSKTLLAWLVYGLVLRNQLRD